MILKIPLMQWPVAAAAICQAQSGCTAQTPWLWGMAGFSQENTAAAWRIQHRSHLVAMESPCISSGKFCCDTAIALTSQNNFFFKNLYHFLSPANAILQNKSMLIKATPLCTHSLPWQFKAHISILDFTQFILLNHVTVPKHFQKVSIHNLFHAQDKEKQASFGKWLVFLLLLHKSFEVLI